MSEHPTSQTEHQSDPHRVAADVASQLRGRTHCRAVHLVLDLLRDDVLAPAPRPHVNRSRLCGWYALGSSVHLDTESRRPSQCCALATLLLCRLYADWWFSEFIKLDQRRQETLLASWGREIIDTLEAGNPPPAFFAGAENDLDLLRRLLGKPSPAAVRAEGGSR